jgi:hypothetical protein
MNKPNFLFGDIVVIHECVIGCILKTWDNPETERYNYEVYNRISGKIELLEEKYIDRYRVRHKYIDEEEMEWQNG